jgi:hypothetical protein
MGGQIVRRPETAQRFLCYFVVTEGGVSMKNSKLMKSSLGNRSLLPPRKKKPSGQTFFLSWMEGVARHINDPVARLRFLRAAAPSASARGARRSYLSRKEVRVVIALLLAVVVCFAIATGYAWLSKPADGQKAPAQSRNGTPAGAASRTK